MMDEKIDLTENRDFRSRQTLSESLDVLTEDELSWINIYIDKQLEKEGTNKKVLKCCNDKIIITTYEDDRRTCDRCGRFILYDSLCDRCNIELDSNITKNNLFNKKELRSIL